MHKNNVSVITVTYGNRFRYLKAMVYRVINDVKYIVIVDNGSSFNNKYKIKKLVERWPEKIHHIIMNGNYGSAMGFKKGIEITLRNRDIHFLWLLDDDNLPRKDALKQLLGFWRKIKIKNKEQEICLVSLRKNRENYLRISEGENVSDVLRFYTNSHQGFNLFRLMKKLANFRKKSVRNKKKQNFIILPYSPYGGMFFSKALISKIGLPNPDLYLYFDDHDFSYRITKNNGYIILVKRSIVYDQEISWAHVFQNLGVLGYFLSLIVDKGSKRVFYSTRNKIIFEKQFINNNLIYLVNLAIFMAITVFFHILFLRFKKLKEYLYAIRAGILFSKKLNSQRKFFL